MANIATARSVYLALLKLHAGGDGGDDDDEVEVLEVGGAGGTAAVDVIVPQGDGCGGGGHGAAAKGPEWVTYAEVVGAVAAREGLSGVSEANRLCQEAVRGLVKAGLVVEEAPRATEGPWAADRKLRAVPGKEEAFRCCDEETFAGDKSGISPDQGGAVLAPSGSSSEEDSDSSLAKNLPRKLRVGLQRLPLSVVLSQDKESEGPKTTTLAGHRVKVDVDQGDHESAGEEEGGSDPGEWHPPPRRAAALTSKRYNDEEFMSNMKELDDLLSGEEEEDEDDVPLGRLARSKRGRSRKRTAEAAAGKGGRKKTAAAARPAKRPKYESDSDYSGGEGDGEDDDDAVSEEYDSGSDASAAGEKRRSALMSKITLLEGIDASAARNQTLADVLVQAERLRLGPIEGSSRVYLQWIRFIAYLGAPSPINRESMKNPFCAKLDDLIDFLDQLVKEEWSLKEYNGIKSFLLSMIGSSEEEEEQCRSIRKRLAQQESAAPSRLKKGIPRRAHEIPGPLASFLVYCSRRKVSPFHCPPDAVASFYRTYLERELVLNLRYFLRRLAKYHSSSYRRDDGGQQGDQQGLEELPEVAGVLAVNEAILAGSLTFAGATEQQERDILSSTADYKYEKYIKQDKPASRFWREKLVFRLLERVFARKAGDFQRANMAAAAGKLGVSFQMLRANFYRLIVPPGTFPELAGTVLAGANDDDHDFWERRHVGQILESVRQQEVELDQGAFELGCGLAELRRLAGEFAEKRKPEKKPPPPKLNSLEKQLKTSAKVEEKDGMSEYEKVRLKNIRERLELFSMLDFGASKNGMKKPKKETSKATLPTRDKSRRIKQKQEAQQHRLDEEEGPGEGKTGRNGCAVRVPHVPELSLEELTSLNFDLQTSKRFLSCVRRELAPDDNSSLRSVGDGGPFYAVTSEALLSSDRLTCAAVSPRGDVDLVVCGNRSGELAVWMDSSGTLEADGEPDHVREYLGRAGGRHCVFHPHSGEIHHVAFVGGSDSRFVTSGQDGTMRRTDLREQRVELLYQWNRFYTEQEDGAVHFFTQMGESETVFLVSLGDGSVAIYDSRAGGGAASRLRTALGPGEAPPDYCSLSARGNFLCVTNSRRSGSVRFFDVRRTGGGAVARWEGVYPRQADFSPDGTKVVVAHNFNPGKSCYVPNARATLLDVSSGFPDGEANGDLPLAGGANLEGYCFRSEMKNFAWLDNKTVLSFAVDKEAVKNTNHLAMHPLLLRGDVSGGGGGGAKGKKKSGRGRRPSNNGKSEPVAVEAHLASDPGGMAATEWMGLAVAEEAGGTPTVAVYNCDGPGRLAVFKPLRSAPKKEEDDEDEV